jgi:NitT/TauT family transport system substrate-binding protein
MVMKPNKIGNKNINAFRDSIIFIAFLFFGYLAYINLISKDGRLILSGKSFKHDFDTTCNSFTGLKGLVLMNIALKQNGNSKRYKTYTGSEGDNIYSRIVIKYNKSGLPLPLSPFIKVSNSYIIQELNDVKIFSANSKQSEAKAESFQKVTSTIIKTNNKYNRIITLRFEPNSSQLKQSDETLIDSKIKLLAKGIEYTYILVEGNTDNIGSASSNNELSLKRATSVVEYLVNKRRFERNKFIVIGNGSRKPICCECNQDDSCLRKNRRTELQFIINKNI